MAKSRAGLECNGLLISQSVHYSINPHLANALRRFLVWSNALDKSNYVHNHWPSWNIDGWPASAKSWQHTLIIPYSLYSNVGTLYQLILIDAEIGTTIKHYFAITVSIAENTINYHINIDDEWRVTKMASVERQYRS